MVFGSFTHMNLNYCLLEFPCLIVPGQPSSDTGSRMPTNRQVEPNTLKDKRYEFRWDDQISGSNILSLAVSGSRHRTI
jgi:hypothetical protein